jgi:hypothetical protein
MPNELLHSGDPPRFTRIERVIVQAPPIDRVIDREPPERLASEFAFEPLGPIYRG